jgi:pyridoxal 5'-phosphate synthase pdxS subunit
MQKGGVIMDVTNAEQSLIAEEAGAVAVMALERVPADIRAEGGVARMANPQKIVEIMEAVTIPVMAKCRIGHFAEAQALESLGVDMVDESEVLTPADPFFHVDKRRFTVPFVCGCRNLGEAVRRIYEGAALIRTKGEAGTGNVVEAVRHMRLQNEAIADLKGKDNDGLHRVAVHFAKSFARLREEALASMGLPAKVDIHDTIFGDDTLEAIELGIHAILIEVRNLQRLPVVDFAAGGIATPADAAIMMQLGCDGVFVGSGIFKSEDPSVRAKAIVEAVLHYDDPSVVAEVSKGLGVPMKGVEISQLPADERLQERGW